MRAMVKYKRVLRKKEEGSQGPLGGVSGVCIGRSLRHPRKGPSEPCAGSVMLVL